jgi:hypothetical protein
MSGFIGGSPVWIGSPAAGWGSRRSNDLPLRTAQAIYAHWIADMCYLYTRAILGTRIVQRFERSESRCEIVFSCGELVS